MTNVIPAMTPLREWEYDQGGRAKVKELVTYIEDRGTDGQAFRVQKVLAQALDYAIHQESMPRNQSQATKQKGEGANTTPSTTHISIWNRSLNCCRKSTSTAALVMSKQCWH